MPTLAHTKTWTFPLSFSGYTLILLNQPLPPSKILTPFYDRCENLIACDGASNHLLSTNPSLLPDLIIGDMKGITKKTLTHYTEKNVKIVKDTDQDTTDLDKALLYAKEYLRNGPIVVLGCFGGRLDMQIGCMHSAVKCGMDVILLSEGYMGICLPGGVRNEVVMHPCQNKMCGLIPFEKNVKCKTDGFKWNIDDMMEFGFGRHVSVSNVVKGDRFIVEADEMVFYTCAIDWQRM